MIKTKYLLSVATVALISSFGAAQAQEDCPRGTLDARYCDRNGDLLADTPTDAADLVNPDTLIFASSIRLSFLNWLKPRQMAQRRAPLAMGTTT